MGVAATLQELSEWTSATLLFELLLSSSHVAVCTIIFA